jgi:hypothetical protein
MRHLFLCFLLPAISSSSWGASSEPPWLPPGFVKLGSAHKTHWGISVYHASLWVAPDSRLPEQPLALQLTYSLSLKGHKIAERSLKEMQQLGLKAADKEQR